MGEIKIDYDFSELTNKLTQLEKLSQGIDEKLGLMVKRTGTTMLRTYKRTAPKKTGKFSRQLVGKFIVESNSDYTYVMYNKENWGKGIFVMNEKGTKLRSRHKIKPKQHTFGVYRTGQVRPKNLTTKIKKDMENKMQKNAEKLLEELVKGV